MFTIAVRSGTGFLNNQFQFTSNVINQFFGLRDLSSELHVSDMAKKLILYLRFNFYFILIIDFKKKLPFNTYFF